MLAVDVAVGGRGLKGTGVSQKRTPPEGRYASRRRMSFVAIQAARNSIFSPAANAAVSAPSFSPGIHANTVFVPLPWAFAIAADIMGPLKDGSLTPPRSGAPFPRITTEPTVIP